MRVFWVTWIVKLWCWRRFLRVLWTVRGIKAVHPKGCQSWIFNGRTDAEATILWPPDVKNWPTGKTLMLGKVEDGRRRGRQRMRWLDGITESTNISLSKLWVIVKKRGAWRPILWPPMRRADSLEKTWMLGKIEGRRRGQLKEKNREAF